MKRIAVLFTVSSIGLMIVLGSGCNEDSTEPSTDKVSARSGWKSTENALGQAGIQAGWSGSGTVDANGVSGMVTGSIDCPEGGSMTVESVGEVTDALVSGTVAIDFNGCTTDGVTIDGSLEYEGRVSETETVGSIHGDLEWSGDADGSCAIDIEARVATDGISVSGSSVNGQMCGYAWNELW